MPFGKLFQRGKEPERESHAGPLEARILYESNPPKNAWRKWENRAGGGYPGPELPIDALDPLLPNWQISLLLEEAAILSLDLWRNVRDAKPIESIRTMLADIERAVLETIRALDSSVAQLQQASKALNITTTIDEAHRNVKTNEGPKYHLGTVHWYDNGHRFLKGDTAGIDVPSIQSPSLRAALEDKSLKFEQLRDAIREMQDSLAQMVRNSKESEAELALAGGFIPDTVLEMAQTRLSVLAEVTRELG